MSGEIKKAATKTVNCKIKTMVGAKNRNGHVCCCFNWFTEGLFNEYASSGAKLRQFGQP